MDTTPHPVDVVANIEEAVREREGQKFTKLQALFDTQKTELERAVAEREAAESKLQVQEQETAEFGQRLAQAEKQLHATEDVEDRLSRAEFQLNELEDATGRDFLILLGIGAVFTGVGFYLQRRYNWKVPWAVLVGSASLMYSFSNKNLPKKMKYVMVGGGAGLALGGMTFTIMNAFPGWHKSP